MNNASCRAAAIALAVFSITAFLGCASSATTTSVSPDDTLVIVPVLIVNLTSTHNQYMDVKYQVNLEHVETGKTESIDINTAISDGYRYKRGFPPGEYIIRDYVPHGLVNANVVSLNVQNHLIVEKGKATLFPLKPIITIRDNKGNGGGGSIFYNEFQEMDKEQMDRIKEYLKSGNTKTSLLFVE